MNAKYMVDFDVHHHSIYSINGEGRYVVLQGAYTKVGMVRLPAAKNKLLCSVARDRYG